MLHAWRFSIAIPQKKICVCQCFTAPPAICLHTHHPLIFVGPTRTNGFNGACQKLLKPPDSTHFRNRFRLLKFRLNGETRRSGLGRRMRQRIADVTSCRLIYERLWCNVRRKYRCPRLDLMTHNLIIRFIFTLILLLSVQNVFEFLEMLKMATWLHEIVPSS